MKLCCYMCVYQLTNPIGVQDLRSALEIMNFSLGSKTLHLLFDFMEIYSTPLRSQLSHLSERSGKIFEVSVLVTSSGCLPAFTCHFKVYWWSSCSTGEFIRVNPSNDGETWANRYRFLMLTCKRDHEGLPQRDCDVSYMRRRYTGKGVKSRQSVLDRTHPWLSLTGL